MDSDADRFPLLHRVVLPQSREPQRHPRHVMHDPLKRRIAVSSGDALMDGLLRCFVAEALQPKHVVRRFAVSIGRHDVRDVGMIRRDVQDGGSLRHRLHVDGMPVHQQVPDRLIRGRGKLHGVPLGHQNVGNLALTDVALQAREETLFRSLPEPVHMSVDILREVEPVADPRFGSEVGGRHDVGINARPSPHDGCGTHRSIGGVLASVKPLMRVGPIHPVRNDGVFCSQGRVARTERCRSVRSLLERSPMRERHAGRPPQALKPQPPDAAGYQRQRQHDPDKHQGQLVVCPS